MVSNSPINILSQNKKKINSEFYGIKITRTYLWQKGDKYAIMYKKGGDFPLEFLTVGNSKIKIMLSAEEAIARGIKIEETDYDDPEIRRAFRKILEEASEKAKFELGKEKLLVQAYPSRDGGIELFVTKLGTVSKEAANMLSKSEHIAVISAKRVFYIFDSFENLLGAVRSIPPGAAEDSSVYRFDDGAYCLSFCEREHRYVLGKLSRLSEFGLRINELAAQSLEEHATLLRGGDAVEVFSRF